MTRRQPWQELGVNDLPVTVSVGQPGQRQLLQGTLDLCFHHRDSRAAHEAKLAASLDYACLAASLRFLHDSLGDPEWVRLRQLYSVFLAAYPWWAGEGLRAKRLHWQLHLSLPTGESWGWEEQVALASPVQSMGQVWHHLSELAGKSYYLLHLPPGHSIAWPKDSSVDSVPAFLLRGQLQAAQSWVAGSARVLSSHESWQGGEELAILLLCLPGGSRNNDAVKPANELAMDGWACYMA